MTRTTFIQESKPEGRGPSPGEMEKDLPSVHPPDSRGFALAHSFSELILFPPTPFFKNNFLLFFTEFGLRRLHACRIGNSRSPPFPLSTGRGGGWDCFLEGGHACSFHWRREVRNTGWTEHFTSALFCIVSRSGFVASPHSWRTCGYALLHWEGM